MKSFIGGRKVQVKNNFPNVDKILRKLKEYNEYFMNAGKEERVAKTALNTVEDFINAIQKYLDSVCNAEDRISRARQTCNNTEDIKYVIESEDSNRTRYHSQIITSMILIDRISTLKGLGKVFDYAEEFQNDFASLTPNSIEEKAKMSPRARIKRREMGNLGLYIGASLTAGMSKEFMITDDEAREFASCESDIVNPDRTIYGKVKQSSRKFEDNIRSALE